jgi:hypothetical protein
MIRYKDTVYRVDVDVSLVRIELETMDLHKRAFDSLKWEEGCIR